MIIIMKYSLGSLSAKTIPCLRGGILLLWPNLDLVGFSNQKNEDFLWRFASSSQPVFEPRSPYNSVTDVVVTSDRVFLWQRPLYKARVARQLGTALTKAQWTVACGSVGDQLCSCSLFFFVCQELGSWNSNKVSQQNEQFLQETCILYSFPNFETSLVCYWGLLFFFTGVVRMIAPGHLKGLVHPTSEKTRNS